MRDLLDERGVDVIDGTTWAEIDTRERDIDEVGGRTGTTLRDRRSMLEAGPGDS